MASKSSASTQNAAFLKSLGLQAATQKKEESLYVPGFRRTLSPYVPSVPNDVKLHECIDCGDKFVLKSSYEMHVNRHTATIEHSCKICRQVNIFINPCQVLAHARKHTNFSLEVNQENLNNLNITPVTQEQLKKTCLKYFDSDLVTRNGSAEGNQNGLINPFANHNFIVTDGGIVAVPNATVGSGGDNKEETNGVSKSLLKKKSPENPPDAAEKPNVKIKDIGSLLKISSGANVINPASLVKTGPSPIVAWSTYKDRTCVECNNYVKPSLTLREHYSTLVGLPVPPTCSICHIQLPSKCALSCHMRLHSEEPPFICPDCVLKFPTFGQLLEHMNKVCFHLDKRVRQKCPVENCKVKVFPNVHTYKKHLVNNHTRSIYKCNLCPIACYTEQSLNSHMKEKHFGCVETPSPYHQCSLCPDRLIPKSRFDNHIEEHVQNSPKMNMYLCKNCHKFNMIRNNHVVHIANCKGKKRPDAEEKPNAKKLKLNESKPKQNSPKVLLTSYTNGGVDGKVLKKTVKTNCFDCKRELTCTFTGETEQQLPIRCPLCYKQSSKQIVKLPCPALVKIESKKEKVSVPPKAKDNKKVVEVDVEKMRDKRIIEMDVDSMIEYSLQDMINDSPNNQLSLIKIDKSPKISLGNEIIPKITLEKDKDIEEKLKSQSPQKKQQPGFICAICQYETDEREQFKFHVATHRDVDTAYQCMECGLSFTVKPTLEKHLRMKHSIEDVDSYVASNSECVDKEAVRAALASVIVGPTVAAEDVEENQCRICKEKFDNAADHDKHFRVHGLAFLKQKELDKITSETT